MKKIVLFLLVMAIMLSCGAVLAADETAVVKLENLEWFLVASIVFGAASEIIGMNPKWKSNAVIQIIGAIFGRIFGKG